MTNEEIKKIVFEHPDVNNPTKYPAKEESTSNDSVNHPFHYQSYGNLNIECIDIMRAAYGDEDVKSFCLCNAMKYLFRCYDKGKNEDIKKAQWYLNKFMELGGFDDDTSIS